MNRLLLRIEVDARWPMRQADEIKASARDTMARFHAMTHLWHESQSPVTMNEYADLLDRQPSHLTIARERKLLEDRTEGYIASFRQNR